MTGSEERIRFSARIADISFHVECFFESTRQLCRDYLIPEGKNCNETISISLEDLEGERQRMLKKAELHPEYLTASPQSVESMHLCRRIAELLPKYDRILFHGSALSIDGKGVIFTAVSGTGKSTHSRLWREVFGDRVEMINDDKPILHVSGDAVTVYGSPWRGKHGLGSNRNVPLAALCQICRAPENHVESMWPKDFIPLALQQTYMPENLDAMVRTVRHVGVLCRSVYTCRVSCNMEPKAAETVYAALNLDGLECML